MGLRSHNRSQSVRGDDTRSDVVHAPGDDSSSPGEQRYRLTAASRRPPMMAPGPAVVLVSERNAGLPAADDVITPKAIPQHLQREESKSTRISLT